MTNHNELSEQLEQVVRQYVASALREAQGVVQHDFGDAAVVRPTGPHTKRGQSGARRSETEIAALGEALYAAVCAQPGETMAMLAPRLGEQPKQLHRPMSRLRRAERVRTVGERHKTRYFPTAQQG